MAERLPYKQDAGGSNRQGLPISLRSSVDRERQITNLEAARSSRAGEAIFAMSRINGVNKRGKVRVIP